jgi:hypothetical protein
VVARIVPDKVRANVPPPPDIGNVGTVIAGNFHAKKNK